MTASNGVPKQPPPRWVLALVAAVAVLVMAWVMLTVNTSPASRACAALYARAETAADSTLVDAVVPDSHRTTGAVSCGVMRTNARW